jgi:antirestriction protein ArdC
MKASDLLPDDANAKDFGGVTVRKGTVGAFIVNHRVFTDPNASPAAKAAALHDMAEAIPAMEALGIFEVFELRNSAVAGLLGR